MLPLVIRKRAATASRSGSASFPAASQCRRLAGGSGISSVTVMLRSTAGPTTPPCRPITTASGPSAPGTGGTAPRSERLHRPLDPRNLRIDDPGQPELAQPAQRCAHLAGVDRLTPPGIEEPQGRAVHAGCRLQRLEEQAESAVLLGETDAKEQ